MNIGMLVMSLGGVQVLTLILCGILWWYFLRQERIINSMRSELESGRQNDTDTEPSEAEEQTFQSEYREAEIKASLQTSGATRHSPTEKYKYVACMADKGLGVEDLARSFGISSYEAE
ncbi:MAG: hypothetical protein V5A14_01980 [Desulfohalobiaceae bacterium]